MVKNTISLAFKAIRKILVKLRSIFYFPYARLILYLNDASVGKNLTINGFTKIEVTRRGKLVLGNNIHINSGQNHNVIGRQQKTILWVEGVLTIGNNVGMSSTAIICNHKITIDDNVTIGGNVVIYDTDFHALDPNDRINKKLDKKLATHGEVHIKYNAFIGAHSTVLKGVTIGKNSVIGACSVVTKEIPDNEIWAGNPAKFIKKIK